MIGAAFVLALVTGFHGGHGDSYSGPASDVGDLSDARGAVEQAVSSYGNPNLEVGEVMEFANNYYAQVKESDTDIFAMELLVDKRASRVHPEPGPHMMWNTKYGMINGARGMRDDYFQTGSEDQMPISSEQATEIADDYLSRVSPGTETEEPDIFYGYYTLHIERDGEVTGILSVNGYSGEVWYHSWHGPFVTQQEEEE